MSHRPSRRYRPSRRTRRLAVTSVAVLALAGVNGPWLYRVGSEQYHQYRINRPAYRAERGHWKTVDVPEQYKINTIHAALLHTGKVLLVAGSGNDAKQFRAKTFRSVLWDPERNTFREIPTPDDLFCAGHTQLPDGNLLVAGGTQRYETLKGDVEKAGGLMIVSNEDPDQPVTLPAGTRFTGKRNGKTFVSQQPLLVPRAEKTTDSDTGEVTVAATRKRIYVEAEHKGRAYATGDTEQYTVEGLTGEDRRNVYGVANKLSFDKKDFQGIRKAFEFDPVAERYVTVDPMFESRWYPTLTSLPDGRVLTVSGLDEIGEVVPGKNEIYDPEGRSWSRMTGRRFFPTYPALFLTQGGEILFTGSSSGYGPADQGRAPGLWNLGANRFRKLPGMSDPDILETSMSVLLPPAQDQRFMVLGGGGVGESPKATAKTRIVDLTAEDPRFTDGPDLYAPARYPSSVILPDDTVLTTNGSGGYRGYSNSNILQAALFDPATDTFRTAADPLVGRNYHSGALLLPDGRVMTFGSDSLFADEANTKPGTFQQQIDVYSPPYLFRGPRPRLTDPGRERQSVRPGGTAVFTSPDAADIEQVRLIRPGSFTHVTNVEQRSLAVDFTVTGSKVRITVPDDPTLAPPGWYMVNVLDGRGIPSRSAWVHVGIADDPWGAGPGTPPRTTEP